MPPTYYIFPVIMTLGGLTGFTLFVLVQLFLVWHLLRRAIARKKRK